MATQHVRRLTTARTQTSRMRGGSALPWLVLLLTVVASVPVSSTPALPHNFTQLVDHFGADGETCVRAHPLARDDSPVVNAPKRVAISSSFNAG